VIRIEGKLAPVRLEELRKVDPGTYVELETSGLIDRDPLLAGQMAAMSTRRVAVTNESWEALVKDVAEFSNRKKLDDAGVPGKLAMAVISGRDEHGTAIDERQPLHELVTHLEAGARIVILAGAAGSGKSIAAAQWILRSGGSWVSGELVASINLKMVPDREIYHDLQRPRSHLVIDDLAITEGPLDSLLVRRFDEDAITVCTMNVAHKSAADRPTEVRAALAKIFGDRTKSRLASDGAIIICDEPMRGRPAKERP